MKLSISSALPRYPVELGRRLLAAAALLAIAGTLGAAAPNKEATTQSGTAAAPLVASQGVLVTGVQAGSPADKAGIARGDIILQADGKAVDTPAALAETIAAKKSGDTLALKLRHGDAEKNVAATLGTQMGRAWLGIEAEGGRFGFGRMPGMGRLGDNRLGNGRGLVLPGPGAFVAAVTAGGPAEKAGIAKGDVIVSVDGTAVDAQHALGDLIAAKKVGDTVTLSVQTGSQEARDVKVTLGRNPDKDAPWLGIQYTLVGPRIGRMMPGFGGPGIVAAGVFVADVAAGSPADKAGIKVRDVITKVEGTAVTDPQQVVDIVAKHKPGDSLVVTVTHAADGSSADLSVALGANPSDASKAYMGVSMAAAQQRVFPALPRAGGTLPDASAPDGSDGTAPDGSPIGSNAPTL